MIVAAAFLPHPPLLFRELTGATDVAAELRAACLGAVTEVLRSVERVAVVGGGDSTRPWDGALSPEVRRFGTTGPPDGPGLPLSLGVARRLLDLAGWRGPTTFDAIAWAATDEEVVELAAALGARGEDTALLVLGDGGARRGDAAPGYVDARAFPFDDDLARALSDGDTAHLTSLDTTLAADLMVLGAAAFRLLGTVARGRSLDASLRYRADPFGVTYLVGTWRFAR